MSALISVLQQSLGIDAMSVRRIIATAPERYKVYSIPKRGGAGRRIIAQPAKEVKALQRILLKTFLSDLPVHPSAFAYVPGKSIRTNAVTHVANGPILKMDFQNFFPSIRSYDWLSYCHDNGVFDSEADARMASKILFRREKGESILRLSIGAPSSPHVSNLLMYEFDRAISDKVAEDYVTYTRYADDLTFSAERTGYLTRVEKDVRKTLRDLRYPRLFINDRKTVLATTKYRREVTGLILTNDHRVSLGRHKKRLLRAQIHRYSKGELNNIATAKLAGNMAFASDVEPTFYTRMERVFTKEVMDRLKDSVNRQDQS
ncbi:MAG TPA: RNA-directed DNA polymerase [Erythrobacter sp.]|jgi:retron-type reverse transcriptase|nr:RNA-directed DNA polymerase [Erythrobacter sp.]HCJ44049.1 RNA-directed DNA polymerase [Erythrobacter sp.]|tara:strand:+ start:1835 stop:2785 length:951 start_codon:yes stop_codon:yes gene_type:complete